MWWHHVEALDNLNVLVNYWWRPVPVYAGAPADVLMHALMSIRDLPAGQRKAWEGLFSHYIFNAGEDVYNHIPEARRGALARMTDDNARKIRSMLLNKLNR
jgi:hypothetical protein